MGILYTWPLWILAAILLALGGVCVFDVWLKVSGRKTISRRTINWLYSVDRGTALAVACAVTFVGTAVVVLIVGILIGHLVWGQVVP
jgi:hypothetical protein